MTIKIIGYAVGASTLLILTTVVFCSIVCCCIHRQRRKRLSRLNIHNVSFNSSEEREEGRYYNVHQLPNSNDASDSIMYARPFGETSSSSHDRYDDVAVTRHGLSVPMSPNVAYNRSDLKRTESNEYAYVLNQLS